MFPASGFNAKKREDTHAHTHTHTSSANVNAEAEAFLQDYVHTLTASFNTEEARRQRLNQIINHGGCQLSAGGFSRDGACYCYGRGGVRGRDGRPAEGAQDLLCLPRNQEATRRMVRLGTGTTPLHVCGCIMNAHVLRHTATHTDLDRHE